MHVILPLWFDCQFRSLVLLGVATAVYSLAFFVPTILRDYGYTAIKAQLYSIPPGICGITWSLGSAFLADRCNHRFTFAIVAITMAVCGLAIAGWAKSTGARYAGIFLAYMGKHPCSCLQLGNVTVTPLLLTWLLNNMGGHVKRSVSSAALLSFANLGGIVASFAFQSSDAPRYLTGYIILVSVLGMTWCLTWVYFLGLRRENKRRDLGKREYLRECRDENELADRHVVSSDFKRLTVARLPVYFVVDGLFGTTT